MLLEEQAAELLLRCERILGITLKEIRGNLRRPRTRAEAVWELFVIEAASYLGGIEYGSPDLGLRIGEGRKISLEATYLNPRFLKEERQSRAVASWLFQEACARGIPAYRISTYFRGLQQGQAGPIRKLPNLNERKLFLKQPELVEFFEGIKLQPEKPRTSTLCAYIVSISYMPEAVGPYASSGGLVQEAPTSVEEHALYRKLKEKADQFCKMPGPLVVCVGSDQSPAFSGMCGPGMPSIQNAVGAFFSQSTTLSAAMVVAIKNVPMAFGGLPRQASTEFLINHNARNPLTQDEIQSLRALEFNRWKYSFPLPKWESAPAVAHLPRRVTGTLNWSPRPMSIKVEIPANIVVDALAGKTSLEKEFNLREDDQVKNAFQEGWSIVSCSMAEGNLEAAEAPKIVLELVPPPLAVFWPKQK